MNAWARWLPHPLLAAATASLWLALAPRLDAAALAGALLVGLLVPRLTRAFSPARPTRVRLRPALRLALVVVGDIIVANWQVARLVLDPRVALRPAIVRVPVTLDDPFVLTVLGSIVSLTPGTVTLEIDRDAGVLIVHALDVGDTDRLVALIQSRYEAALREVFAC